MLSIELVVLFKSDDGTSMCIDDGMISLIHQLVSQGHRLYVISGHQNEHREKALKELLPNSVEIRMSHVFNSVAQLSSTGPDPAAMNKASVVQWLQSEVGCQMMLSYHRLP